MPIREFQCGKCGHIWEEVILVNDEAAPQCSHCESYHVVRLPSAFGGYGIKGSNDASVRPKGAGSSGKRKNK